MGARIDTGTGHRRDTVEEPALAGQPLQSLIAAPQLVVSGTVLSALVIVALDRGQAFGVRR